VNVLLGSYSHVVVFARKHCWITFGSMSTSTARALRWLRASWGERKKAESLQSASASSFASLSNSARPNWFPHCPTCSVSISLETCRILQQHVLRAGLSLLDFMVWCTRNRGLEREAHLKGTTRRSSSIMYNGIGLRTVRGSGTNGYVQRNLSYVNASRTRQTLARNQRGGSSGDFGGRGGGKSRPPPNAEILAHEQKRKVELELLEMSLEMEDRGCDPEEIQDKVKRERERLLARLNDVGGRDKPKDAESSHARQRRKDEENRRIKDAFGIATDYVAGESFDPEMQERRRVERKERREREWQEREEARQQRLKAKDERDEKMRARRERFRSPHSRSRSRSRRSRSPVDRRSRDRRSRGRDDAKPLRESKSRSRSPVVGRRSRPPSTAERKRRSVSSSSSASSDSRSSSRLRSRSRSHKARKDKRSEKDSAEKNKKTTRSHSRSRSSSSSSSGSCSGSDSDRSPSSGRTRGGSRGAKTKASSGKIKEEKLSVSVSPARAAVRKGEHKVLNLSGRSASVSAVANDDDAPMKAEKKKEKNGGDAVKKAHDAKSPAKEKQEAKPAVSSEKKVEKQESLPAALPVSVKKEEKTAAKRSSRRSRSPVADPRTPARKRKLRSASPEDRRRRERSTSSASSRASRSPRRRRVHSPSCSRSSGGSRSRSRSASSGSSRSRSRSEPRGRRRSSPRRRRRSPSGSRSRGRSSPRGRRR
jgi:serine/arginine repetitive matrix protein 2